MAGLPLAVVKFSIRVLLILGILAYFLIAAGLLAARYWLLPNIDQWRPQIEQAISQAANIDIRFDRIQAQWYGLNANLEISNLRILDADGVTQLGVPTTTAVLSWRSIFRLEPVFRYIGMDELVMVARRAPEGDLYLAGFKLEATDQTQTNIWDLDGVRWLLNQGRINVSNTRMAWVDQYRNAVPLVINDIDLTLDNGLFGHELNAKVSLPEQWGGVFEFVAKIDAVHGPAARLLTREPSGYFFASVSEIYPQAMKPWVDVPGLHGSFAGRLWVDLMSGQLTNFTVNLAGRGAVFQQPGQAQDLFRMGRFQWRATGPIATLGVQGPVPGLIDLSRTPRRVTSSLSIEDGFLRAPSSGMGSLLMDQLTTDLALSRLTGDGLRLDIQDMALANADGLITARGSWILDDRGKGGVLDIEGTLARFLLPSLYRYLPDDIGQDAHDWLSVAFKSGVVPRASFEIKGSVDGFPYSSGVDDGLFKVDGTVQDWTLDYAPVQVGELPWPLLTDLSGTLSLFNDRIAVQIDAGSLTLPKGQRINLSQLAAQLVDLEEDPVVTVNSKTAAAADIYLALFRDTALKDVAPEFVQGFAGAGDWSMPLELRVPLDDVTQTSFKGALGFNGGSVGYEGSPQVMDLQGTVILTETGFETKGLAGTLLGGPLQIEGGINEQQDTLAVSGVLRWNDWAKHLQSSVLAQLLKGESAYGLTFSLREDEQFSLLVESDLSGTEIMLPAPLGKQAGQSATTRLSWVGSFAAEIADNLSFSIANRLSMTATTATANRPASFFSSVNMAIGAAKPMPGRGLTLSINSPSIDLETWMPVIDGLTEQMQAQQTGTPLMPSLGAARLETNELVLFGNPIQNLVATLAVSDGIQHELNIESVQTKGKVSWATSQGVLHDGFVAKFDRLEIGGQADDHRGDGQGSDELAALPEPGSISRLPMIDLEISDVTLFGTRLGSLSLLGANSTDSGEWQIRRLQIKNPHLEVTASGRCRFDHNPGVSLDIDMAIENLGDLAQFMGHGEPVRNGRGTLQASLDWAGFPWRFDYAGLSGTAQLALVDGVFDHVSSSSARVLELLSLQSLGRLLDTDINREETFAQGFPWTAINGSLTITEGLVSTPDLTVDSPVATMSLTGDSSLVHRTWDMRAVVRPDLDLSGTAVVTGFLVNPLVGLSALIGQYLLRNPVESALSQRYRVTGTWDEPKIESGAGQESTATEPLISSD